MLQITPRKPRKAETSDERVARLDGQAGQRIADDASAEADLDLLVRRSIQRYGA